MHLTTASPNPDTVRFAENVERSMNRAIRKLYEERASQNASVSILRNGKVISLPATDLLRELDGALVEPPGTQTPK